MFTIETDHPGYTLERAPWDLVAGVEPLRVGNL